MIWISGIKLLHQRHVDRFRRTCVGCDANAVGTGFARVPTHAATLIVFVSTVWPPLVTEVTAALRRQPAWPAPKLRGAAFIDPTTRGPGVLKFIAAPEMLQGYRPKLWKITSWI